MRALIACFVLAAPALAQKSAEKPAPYKKPPVVVPGYVAYKIQGFTVYVSDETLAVPEGKFERSPIDVLDGELGTVAAAMDKKSVDALRRLVIWAEWADAKEGETGRGTPVALYRSGPPASMVRQGLHPLKSKTVDVVNMESLTQEHQPKRDSHRCVLLHEFAHAVHDQLIGWENPAVKAAFAQAMERKLYDKGQYVTTSSAEFFAELTCSYLDRLNYYPATREDLQKHDPATYKLMQKVWGPGLRKPPPPPDTKGDPTLTLAALKFGPTLVGPEPDAAELAGKLVLVVWWGGPQSNALDRAARLRDELGDYGLVVIGAYPYVKLSDAEVRAEGAKRGPGCRVVRSAFVPVAGEDKPINLDPPTAYLFDEAGKCVHKSSVFAAEKAVRAAVGAKLLAEAGGGTVPAGLEVVAEAFVKGSSPVAVLPRVSVAARAGDAATREASQKLRELILKPVVATFEAAAANAAADPAGAFLAAERVADEAKGTATGYKAAALADKLRRTKEAQQELKARKALEPITKLAGKLRGQEGSYDPDSPAFRAQNAGALVQLQRMAALFRTRYAGTKAVAEMDKDIGEFGL